MVLETGHARGIIEINGLHHIPVPQEGSLAFRWAASCRRVTTGILFNQVENDACVLVEFFPQLRIPLGTASPFQRLPHRDVSQAIEGTGDASGFLLWRIRRHSNVWQWFRTEGAFPLAAMGDVAIGADLFAT